MKVRELICRELAKSSEADPSVVARRTLPRLTNGHREELLIEGLEAMAHDAVVLARAEKRAGTPARSGPSRWRVAAPERVWVMNMHKLLSDCAVEDLQWLAADYRMRAEQLADKAADYERLALDLERSGCATVGEMQARTGQQVAA